MNIIYDLRNDVESIKHMQNAMNSNSEFIGLKNTHGLIGSQEWWAAINTSSLKKETIKGAVRGLWLGQWETGPAEFLIELESGETFQDLCYMKPNEAKRTYNLGQFCEIEYVLQEFKKPIPNLGAYSKVILKISLGEINKNTKPIGPCYFTYEHT